MSSERSVKFTTQKRKRDEDNENNKSENKMEIEGNDDNKNKLLSPTNQNNKEGEIKQKKEKEKEKEIQNKETIKFETEDIKINNNIISLNEDDSSSKYNDDNKKKTKKRVKERNKEDNDKYITKLKKRSIKSEKVLGEGFENFIQSKYEWDIFFLVIILEIQNALKYFESFPEDFSYYIYNNLRGIKTCKEFINIIKNPPNKKELYEQSALLYQKRNKLFLDIAKIYNIKLYKNYLDALNKNNNNINNIQNIQNTNNNKNTININNNQNPNNNNNIQNTNNNTSQNVTNNSNSTPIQNNPNPNTNNQNNMTIINNEALASFNSLKNDFKIELFVSALIYNSLIRNEKDQEKFDKEFKKNKQGINPIKFEVINNNLGEEAMIAVITGIKFNNNIVEINLSGNMLGPKSLFWLGSVFKTNQNINVLDLTKCNIDNDALFMLIEGTKFTNENLNNELLNLNKLPNFER